MIYTHVGQHGLRDYQSFDRHWHGDGYSMKVHACNADPKAPGRYRGLCGARIVPGEGSLDSELSGVSPATEASPVSCKRCRAIIAGKSVDAKARAAIEAHLASCLPPGTPPCYRSISKARNIGTARIPKYAASVVMYDGKPAKVEVFRWAAGGWGHRWTAMIGGAAFYQDGRWQREPVMSL